MFQSTKLYILKLFYNLFWLISTWSGIFWRENTLAKLKNNSFTHYQNLDNLLFNKQLKSRSMFYFLRLHFYNCNAAIIEVWWKILWRVAHSAELLSCFAPLNKPRLISGSTLKDIENILEESIKCKLVHLW